MALTGRFVALTLLGVLLAIASARAAEVYAAGLVLVALVDCVSAGRITDVRLQRQPSSAVRLGETGETRLRITNTGRRPLRALVRDAWVPSAGVQLARQEIVVPRGERRVMVSALRPTRRGERRTAQVVLRSYGPLGLLARQRRLPVPGTLRVLPPFTSRSYLPEKLSRLRLLDGVVLVRQRGQGTEFDSLRTYVLGDDVRSIDWRATARSRDVVVRTWRPERDRRVVLALDTGRSAATRIGNEPRLDAALDAALLVAAVAARAGDRVGLVAADVAVRARLGATSGDRVLPTLVDALAPLEPNLVETDPQLLAGEVLKQGGPRALVILFGSLDTGADTGLVPAARALATRHEVVVASVADPALARMRTAVGSPAEVYRAAAADLAIGERDRVADELRRLGVHVVDAPADRFASRVADAYLDLKAAGRL